MKTAIDDPDETELNAQEKARMARATEKLNSFLRYGDCKPAQPIKVEPSTRHEDPRSWAAAEALLVLRKQARTSIRSLVIQSKVDAATHKRLHNGVHVPWPYSGDLQTHSSIE